MLLLSCLVLVLYLYIHFLSLLKHDLNLYITDTALRVSQSLYCFTTSISRGVENYFPRLSGMGISDAIFQRFEGRFTIVFLFLIICLSASIG